MDAFPANHELMISEFAAAFFKMGAIGHNPSSVRIRCYFVQKKILATNHVSSQLTDCSAIIPKPPALNDVPEFPPQQFLADIQQSVSSPFWLPLQLPTQIV